MKSILILSSFLVVTSFGYAQKVSPRAKSSDSLNAIPFINTIEQSLNLFFNQFNEVNPHHLRSKKLVYFLPKIFLKNQKS
jgi:hypothetical protein